MMLYIMIDLGTIVLDILFTIIFAKSVAIRCVYYICMNYDPPSTNKKCREFLESIILFRVAEMSFHQAKYFFI